MSGFRNIAHVRCAQFKLYYFAICLAKIIHPTLPFYRFKLPTSRASRALRFILASSTLSTFAHQSATKLPIQSSMDWSSLKTAIIVCCHAVYNGGPHLTTVTAAEDKNWSLQSFQTEEPPIFIEHVHRGVKLAAADPTSLLIFSGGQTRPPNILSEAQGYHHIAQLHNFWDHPDVRKRVTTEEFATDSYDNVLFGIARFIEAVGNRPEHLTIVTWAFKERRFRYHAWCIRWPMARFCFDGSGVPSDVEQAKAAEEKTLERFVEDPTGHGNVSSVLSKKKQRRNPYHRQHGYLTSCPTMAAVLCWKRIPRVDRLDVPWGDLK